jgi:hypothetical protein
MKCPQCEDCCRVCEEHPDRPRQGEHACRHAQRPRCRRQDDLPGLPEAIHRLVEIALKGKNKIVE